MTAKEWESAKPGALVSVEGIGVMQVWSVSGIKCLRAAGVIGYNFYEITDFSKVTPVYSPAPTGAQNNELCK
jgi:hypothetical protein